MPPDNETGWMEWTDVQLRARVHSQGELMTTMKTRLDEVADFHGKIKTIMLVTLVAVLTNLGVSVWPTLGKAVLLTLGIH